MWLTLTVDDGDAVIKVRDTGPGVPVDRQESIFEPFTQGEPAARQGGLGIGLSLVRRIVELHSGSVDVGSTDDGAEFTVRLPITDEIPPVPSPARVTVLRQRIVVIEDNDDAREALVTALGLMGHEVRAAATGQAGIELVLRGQPPDHHPVNLVQSEAPPNPRLASTLSARHGNRIVPTRAHY